ncbi:MAG: futalosine hydrolase [Planctomycetes bacterium]|jgi:futalosine hydrolase|nr:futalosine hydrolase [Planctomycetota bacterium]MCP4838404.1 futalosine hydrolase [Planctomycetota bacterium]
MRTLIVTAVETESEACKGLDAHVVISGIGRTNAAAATTLAVVAHGPFDAVLSVGVAGSLPGGNLSIGDVVAASACIYAEEGIVTPSGVHDVQTLGFPLGDFEGNEVPCCPNLVRGVAEVCPATRIATVATCSGTDTAAKAVADRTGCAAEAMEGAAVVHAARRLSIPAIEIRAISNTTGDRGSQQWDLKGAIAMLADALPVILSRLE